ncbi:WDFY family member 4, partial [Clonorchis sinensis]
TKRGILSCAASLYDPLGYVAPLLLQPKQLLQELCRSKCGWDEEVNQTIQDAWKKWRNDIQLVDLFSDASEVGYGAVAYLRCEPLQQVHCSLLMGKSRVAPIKSVTIPRLELQAAVLAVRLMCHLLKQLEVRFDNIYFWTDSMIVLHYIFSTSLRFKTFVANRISFIHENTNTSQWRHVPTNMNPADCASRGIRTKHSQLLKLWIQGPEFLKLGEQQRPKTDIEQFHHKPTDPELKRAATVLVTATTDLPTDVLFSYYSSWVRLRRAVAWFTRFKSYLHSKLVGKGIELKNTLRLDELNEAERSVLRYVQLKTFPSELSTTSKLDSKT